MEPTEDQFRLPGGFLIPAVALILCLWLITYASMTAWLTTAGFFLLGSILYFASGKNRNK